MEFELNDYGHYGYKPPTVMELTIKSENTTITEDVIDFKSGKVPQSIIDGFLDVVNQLVSHNESVDEWNRKTN